MPDGLCRDHGGVVLEVPEGLVERAADLLVVDQSSGRGRVRSDGQVMAGASVCEEVQGVADT